MPGFFAGKCADTLVIAGPTVHVIKENVCAGTERCWYWIRNYQPNGEGSEEGRDGELHFAIGRYFLQIRNKRKLLNSVVGRLVS